MSCGMFFCSIFFKWYKRNNYFSSNIFLFLQDKHCRVSGQLRTIYGLFKKVLFKLIFQHGVEKVLLKISREFRECFVCGQDMVTSLPPHCVITRERRERQQLFFRLHKTLKVSDKCPLIAFGVRAWLTVWNNDPSTETYYLLQLHKFSSRIFLPVASFMVKDRLFHFKVNQDEKSPWLFKTFL